MDAAIVSVLQNVENMPAGWMLVRNPRVDCENETPAGFCCADLQGSKRDVEMSECPAASR